MIGSVIKKWINLPIQKVFGKRNWELLGLQPILLKMFFGVEVRNNGLSVFISDYMISGKIG